MKKIIWFVVGLFILTLLLLASAFIAYLNSHESMITERLNQSESSSSLANPASEYCLSQGGKLEIQDKEDGSQYGLCYFEDNRACEEWALFRGYCPIGGRKTTGFDTIEQMFCAWSGGETVAMPDSSCTLPDGRSCLNEDLYTGNCPPQEDLVLADSNDFYNIKINLPQEEWDYTNKINEWADYIFADRQEAWSLDGEIYQLEQEINKDFPERAEIKYELAVNYDLNFASDYQTRSYRFHVYEYTGGANGRETINSYSFNEAGLVSIEDILLLAYNNNDITLSEMMRTKILADPLLKDYTNKEMVDQGLGLNCLNADKTFNTLACQLDGYFYGANLMNFSIRNSGLTFTFNEYEVAAGAVGTPSIFFGWEELEPFLNPNWDKL